MNRQLSDSSNLITGTGTLADLADLTAASHAFSTLAAVISAAVMGNATAQPLSPTSKTYNLLFASMVLFSFFKTWAEAPGND